jgi:predicted lipase
VTILFDAAMAAWAAYGEDPKAPKPEAIGYTNVQQLPGNRGFIGVKDSCLDVCIRGTYNIVDFVTDVKTEMIDVPMATSRLPRPRIHDGFEEDTFSLLLAVNTAVAQTAPKTIRFRGHSLGGAIATALARMARFPGQCEVITFGSPRVGDKTFVAWQGDRIVRSIRVVHDRDLIPCLPPANLGYVHVDKLLHLTQDGDRLRWFHRLFRRITGDLPLLEDHPIHLYADACRAYESP